jgi:hypothetical protein
MRCYAIDPANPTQHSKIRAETLLYGHPDEIIALAEIFWRQHAAALGSQAAFAWPQKKIARVLDDHGTDWWTGARGVPPPAPAHRDHIIYAYLIEKTGIFDIFRTANELYKSDADMPTRSEESQRFWRMADCLIFSAPAQNTVWDLACRIDGDEQARRKSLHGAFGFEVAAENPQAQGNIRKAPTGSASEFVSHFEAFGTEVWRGIVNRKNTTRANDTNYEAIVMHATWLHDMLKSKRQRSNLSLEEFRAAGIMSLLHLAVDFDTAIVKDFKAEANDPGERLDRIAERVGIAANPNARALFEMAPVFSKLLRFIELDQIRDAASAERLCRLSPLCDWTAKVINLYSETTGRDLRVRRTEVVALPVHPRIQRRVLALQAPY